MLKHAQRKEKRKIKRASLSFKVIGVIEISLFLFGVAIGLVGFFGFQQSFKREYSESTFNISVTASGFVNGDKLAAYVDHQEAESYQQIKNVLDEYCISMNVSSISVIVPETSDCSKIVYVFNSKNIGGDTEQEWALGYKRELNDPELSQKLQSIMEGDSSNEVVFRFGEQVISMVAVYGESGLVKGVLYIQRPVNELTNTLTVYVGVVAGATILIGVVIAFITSSYIKKRFVKPVEKISKEAARFASENTLGQPLGKVSTINEISDLASSIDTLEADMVNYISNITSITAEKEHLQTELNLAANIQQNAIPHDYPAFPERTDFNIFGSMTPALGIGGDFYNYKLIDDDHLAMWIGDVSGKGIPAALFMMSVNSMITGAVHSGGTPAEMLMQVNNHICENNEAEMFVTVWLGILELSTGKLIHVNAGHEDPVLYQNGKFELLTDKHCFIIGGRKGIAYRNLELTLTPRDKFFIYTDGVPEATNGEGKMFRIERALEALDKVKEGSPEEVLKFMKKSVDEFVGVAVQFDDLTMLCIEYKPKR